jgi:hypothetical protein
MELSYRNRSARFSTESSNIACLAVERNRLLIVGSIATIRGSMGVLTPCTISQYETYESTLQKLLTVNGKLQNTV